ncbi:spermidine hydroxycinnamoyl transferase [Quercus suber]|uniref:Spermidine hydroxycinnamoyl transferase n=1 Tax=Quercus suber TaxID=58331 RepID=A0AAW0LDT5_QUESU
MINISIKSNSMVIPSKPTPNGLLQLSEIDQAAQWTHAPVIHIYKPNNNIPSSFEKTKNALAQRCDLENNEIPFLDRTVLKSSEPLMKPRFDHIAYTTKSPFVIRSLDAKEGQKKETSMTLLKLTREQVEGLKNKANNETPYQENGVST